MATRSLLPPPMLLAACTLVMSLACAAPGPEVTDESQLQRRAAFDFNCPEDRIVLTHLGGTGAPLAQWGAAGCDQRAVYYCVARDTTVDYPRGVCVWQRESTRFPPVGDAGARPADAR